MHQSRRAGPSRSASRCYPRTRRRPSTLTSLGMWKRLSKVIVSRSNRPHGTDPRFQCADYSRAPGTKRAADACRDLGQGREYRYRGLRGYSDRTGPRRSSCRYVAAKGEAAAVHSGASYCPTHASSNGVSCPSCRSDRWREPSERHSSTALRSVDRGNGLRTRLQRSHGQSPPLQDDSWLVGRAVLVAEFCNHFAITSGEDARKTLPSKLAGHF